MGVVCAGGETLLEATLTDADLTVETFEPKSGEDGVKVVPVWWWCLK